MSIEPLLIIELALLGLVTGFLAGLLGIGGGMIMVPFISAILAGRAVAPGLAVKMAIATSMASILFTSVSSVRDGRIAPSRFANACRISRSRLSIPK